MVTTSIIKEYTFNNYWFCSFKWKIYWQMNKETNDSMTSDPLQASGLVLARYENRIPWKKNPERTFSILATLLCGQHLKKCCGTKKKNNYKKTVLSFASTKNIFKQQQCTSHMIQEFSRVFCGAYLDGSEKHAATSVSADILFKKTPQRNLPEL